MLMKESSHCYAELLLDPPMVQKRVHIHVPAGQMLREALEEMNFHPVQPVVALVNGKVCDLNYRLQPGDKVRFLAQISGGTCS
jgi:sulfur carrier protein ThiS